MCCFELSEKVFLETARTKPSHEFVPQAHESHEQSDSAQLHRDMNDTDE